ncbi:MAG: hypothetical protein JO088_02630 [Acidobacteria bacterium]|nr:hypothetical protein [Acidobacteriota bacterium]MBV9071084.1 hypothetical protein [Acidobacteriota bacterium]
MDDEKQQLDQTIVSARDRVGDRIDELDRRLRKQLDFKGIASEHAPQLVAGGAVVGLLVGFGFPKLFKRVIQIGLPVALVAYGVKKAKANHDADGALL